MKVFIGVAWPYATGPRHLGHLAGAYLPADISARYHRLAGDEVLMVSGTDQHGTPVTLAAEAAGRPVVEVAEEAHREIAASFERVGISFDLFTRTSTPPHHAAVQDVFARLHARGLVTEGVADVALCPAESRSLPDRYVEGRCPHCGNAGARGDQCDTCGRSLDPEELREPVCRRCGASVVFAPQRQLFLRLDLLQDELARWVRGGSRRWRFFAGREAAGVVVEGLRPRSITRDLDWGVPVPLAGWEGRRLYVWFDAVIGYLSASMEWARTRGEPEAWRSWWEDPDAVHRYFIGKDNLFFHALFWPGILLGAGNDSGRWRLPDDLVVSHFLTDGGQQMSSSRGHGYRLDDALDRLGVDTVRHAVCALSPETADSEWRWDEVESLTRVGLLGSTANPAYRVASLLWRRFGGDVPGEAWSAGLAESGPAAAAALSEVGDCWAGARFRDGLAGVHRLGRTVNRLLAETEPWKAPDAEALVALARVLPYLDALAVAAWPVVPGVAGRVAAAFGRPSAPEAWAMPAGPPRVGFQPEPPLDRPPETPRPA